MELATDQLLARVLLTLATLGYSVGPAFADLNATHATNPLWTPHARFHVVWQIMSYLAFGAIALGLIWIGGPTAPGRLYLAALMAGGMYLAFFVTAIAMPLYGGKVTDVNGYPPLKVLRLRGREIVLDGNMTIVSVQTVVLVLALLAIR